MATENVDVFLGLPRGSFDHIPSYCKAQALAAIAEVRILEQNGIFRTGVHYIVLMDLCASTEAAKLLGQKLHEQRIQSFVTAAVAALGGGYLKAYAHFVKQIGDAVLLIFSSFIDLVSWWREAHDLFTLYSSAWNREVDTSGKPVLTNDLMGVFQIRAKTVVHIGEISYFDRNDPISVAVNQIFKIEKKFGPGDLGATQNVFDVAEPFFAQLDLTPTRAGSSKLPGHTLETPLWLLESDEASKYDLA